MGDVTSKQVTKVGRSESLPVTIKENKEKRHRCTCCFEAESCQTVKCPVKLLSYTCSDIDRQPINDSTHVARENDAQINNEMTAGINSKSSTTTYAGGSINEAFIASSPDSSPKSSASSSYSFCDDSLLQMLKEYESDGLGVSDCTRKRSYIHFPFTYPSLKELTSTRVKLDYDDQSLLDNEPATCDLSLFLPSTGTEETKISTLCDSDEDSDPIASEVTSSFDLQRVLNADELNEWPWPDNFELTSSESNISLSFLKGRDRRPLRAIRTIIIDCDRDLKMTEDNHTSLNDDHKDAVDSIAIKDLYHIIKELSPMPIRKSWNMLESAAKAYVKGLLTAEDFSLLDWTHAQVFPVA